MRTNKILKKVGAGLLATLLAMSPLANAMPAFAATEGEAKQEKTSYEGIDFSSKRLIVGISDEDMEWKNGEVLSYYDGVILAEYETAKEAYEAYQDLKEDAAFVEADTTLSISDGNDEGNADVTMTSDENPLVLLEKESQNIEINSDDLVALVDTGASDVAESVSVIGDDASDDNGHGTKMANLIKEKDPDVNILSIKAFDGNGKGTVSAVYAALRLAIEKGATIINISASALRCDGNEALRDVIAEAINSGVNYHRP